MGANLNEERRMPAEEPPVPRIGLDFQIRAGALLHSGAPCPHRLEA
jgi:hypothetical protein